eukprot:CAMPEP_0197514880 /NCGR_PEP_ID=MMETSP1318-20131121/180_1 /TAXON_ID=552666 /ORGANISM="Partenskyella glossopodia, Strain RCC365" /LENGTH=201 /DNA_ID=CAMNT_0043063093 /DNA_START=135 /DNA_END=737 /DNA_ORIENTATION=-
MTRVNRFFAPVMGRFDAYTKKWESFDMEPRNEKEIRKKMERIKAVFRLQEEDVKRQKEREKKERETSWWKPEVWKARQEELEKRLERKQAQAQYRLAKDIPEPPELPEDLEGSPWAFLKDKKKFPQDYWPLGTDPASERRRKELIAVIANKTKSNQNQEDDEVEDDPDNYFEEKMRHQREFLLTEGAKIKEQNEGKPKWAW